SGLFSRKMESAPRDRIRSVDLTSKLTHQLFSLSVVKIGTGRQQAGLSKKAELVLDAVDSVQARQLHDELLDRREAPASAAAGSTIADDAPATGAGTGSAATSSAPPDAAATAPSTATAASRLASFNPAWVFYELLSAWVLVWPGVVIGG